jgi:hypothetical protein
LFTVNIHIDILLYKKGCSEISTEECPECLSGESSCPEIDDQCWVQGSCMGTFITEVHENQQKHIKRISRKGKKVRKKRGR